MAQRSVTYSMPPLILGIGFSFPIEGDYRLLALRVICCFFALVSVVLMYSIASTFHSVRNTKWKLL